MPTEITSAANPHVKEVLRLEKRSERDRRRIMLIEGVREAERALAAGLVPHEAYVCRDLLAPEAATILARLHALERSGATRLFFVSATVYARLAVREESGGILLLAPYLVRTLGQIRLRARPLIAVVEGVEKPGNLGAILRSADGAGVDLVLVTQGNTDIHNPNVVRASLGAIFTVPVVECSTTEAVDWLKSHGIKIVAASPEAKLSYTKVDMRSPLALVLGSEAHGLSDAWRSAADELILIPMAGVVDSLNLATAAALLFYEAVRQRA